MKLRELRLSTRITIGALMLVTAGAAVLVSVEDARIHDAFLSEHRSHLKNSLETEKLRLNQTIDALRKDTLFLSGTPAIGGLARAAQPRGGAPHGAGGERVWARRLEQIFVSFLQAHPDCYQVRFIGLAGGGRDLVRVDNHWGEIEVAPSGSPISGRDREYVKAAPNLRPGDVHLTEFELEPSGGATGQAGRPTLRAMTPVFADSGKMFGIVAVSLDVSRLLMSAESDLLGARAYISNRDGQYLLHPDPGQAFRFEPGSKNLVTTDFPAVEKMFEPQAPEYLPLEAASTDAGAAWVSAQRVYFDPADPSRFLLLLYSIPASGWSIHIPTIPRQNIVGGLTVMLLMGGMAMLYLRRVFTPLEKIAASANRIAAGGHEIQLPQYAGGEIGALANALNVMLERLSQREKLLRESEARYRRLHESMMDAYVMVDMSHRILESNRAFQEMLGYSAEELRSMTCVSLTPEKWHEYEAKIVNEQIAAWGRTEVYEKEYIRKDGTALPVELRAFLLRGENGQRDAMWAIVRDITERKRAELSLRKSRDMLRDAQRLGQLGSWELDMTSGELLWSEETYRIFELDPAHLSPSYENFLNAVHPDDREMVNRAYSQSLQNREPYDIAHRLLFADGRIKWVREQCTSDFDASGRPLRSVGAIQDITRQKRAEEEIATAGEKFRMFFESISDAVFISDLDGRFIQVNRSACERLDYSCEELQQMSFADLDTPEYGRRVPEWIEELKAKKALVFESAHVSKGGRVVPIELSARITEYDGRPTVMAVARDIGERKQAQEELQTFFNLMPDLACIASADGRFLKLNRAWQELLGYSEEKLLATPFMEFIHPVDRDATAKEVERQIGGGSTMHFVNRYRCKDGSYRWLEWQSAPAVGKTLLYATARDITERRRAEKQLRKSAEEIADLYNHAPCGYHSLDRDGNILRINDTELSWLGYTRDEAVGKLRWPDLLVSSSLDRFRQTFPQLMKQGAIRDVEVEMIRKDGSTFIGLINASAIYGPDGGFLMTRSTIVDITERKRVERQLQQLSAHLQIVREEEKARIAREIHDELGGTLTALKMDAYWLAKNLPSDKIAAPLLKRATAMSKLLDNAVAVTRRIITDLRPTVLDDLGLLAALEWQAAQFQKRTGIKCRVYGVEEDGQPGRQYAIALFRIFQETLTNVARHSGASRVEVEFHCGGGEAMLSISDNGRGLPEGVALAPTSYGIRGMCERVDQLGGKIGFDSPPGGGFRVTVTLPLYVAKMEGIA